MSTSAIIKVCNGNDEAGVIVLYADGYPQFAREQLLKRVSEDLCVDEHVTAETVLDAIPHALAGLYDYNIYENEESLRKWENSFDEFVTFDEASKEIGGGSYHYTVHVVNGKVYY